MWDSLVVNPLIQTLVFLNGVIGSYGLAIILLTLFIRLLTVPLTLQQLRSSSAMRELQPKLQELQDQFGDDREKMAQEQMKLYQEAGVNPAAGCLPMLVQMPVWIGLYQALRNMAGQGLLDAGFLWLPTLGEPGTQWQGLSWLWPLPPQVGWETAVAYLVLPILTMVSQWLVQRLMSSPTSDGDGEGAQAMMNQMMLFMPLMFGFFALQVPAGLALYWFTSNVFALAQQYAVTELGLLDIELEEEVSTEDTGRKRDVKRKAKRNR